jgi:hypothetical protein
LTRPAFSVADWFRSAVLMSTPGGVNPSRKVTVFRSAPTISRSSDSPTREKLDVEQPAIRMQPVALADALRARTASTLASIVGDWRSIVPLLKFELVAMVKASPACRLSGRTAVAP